MNYLELCNEVLSELYYETVTDFNELDTIEEGVRTKRLLNRALRTICNNENGAWQFRERTEILIPIENTSKYDKPNGLIRYIKYPKSNLVLTYFDCHKTIPSFNKGMPVSYWMDANKIRLYPVPNRTYNDNELHIHYLTYNYAKDCCGLDKPKMEFATDVPIIPENHRELLVWKVCADWRANVGDPNSQFYKEQYKSAYRALLNDCKQTEDSQTGLHIMNDELSYVQQMVDLFNNPYTISWERKN